MAAFVDPVAMLREACAAAGSQVAWARRHGVHETQVSAVLRGRRLPDISTLAALGVVKIFAGTSLGYRYRRGS